MVRDPVAGQLAQYLFGFARDFFFFIGNVRDDIANNVPGGNAAPAGPGNGLEGGDGHGMQIEGNERFQNQGQSGHRTVGVGDDKAGGFLQLLFNQDQVRGIHFGDQQRHIRNHAVRTGIGKDIKTLFTQLQLEFAGNARRQG